jgi:hypothetical protein
MGLKRLIVARMAYKIAGERVCEDFRHIAVFIAARLGPRTCTILPLPLGVNRFKYFRSDLPTIDIYVDMDTANHKVQTYYAAQAIPGVNAASATSASKTRSTTATATPACRPR